MTNTLRPGYYQDPAGHDLFWEMEHNYYPAAFSIGFCSINIAKYRQRAGKKTTDPTKDLQKAHTYEVELTRLQDLYLIGTITNDRLDEFLLANPAAMTKLVAQAEHNPINHPAQPLTRPERIRHFVNYLTVRRHVKGQSQVDLAHQAGISRAAIAIAETTQRVPTDQTLSKWALALDVDPKRIQAVLKNV